MLTPRPLLSLRNLLLADAATCAAMGALLALGQGAVAALTEIPAALLFYAGLSLFPIAAFMAIVAARPGVHPAAHPAAVWLVIAGNVLWVVGSLLLLLGGWFSPNALGVAFIAAQALVVALLAKLEHDALRETQLRLRTS